MARQKRDPKTVELAKTILESYNLESVGDIQEALKDIFVPLFEQMLQGEMTSHLGYDIHSKQEKETNNRRNGFGSKKVKTSFGEVPIDVARDREVTFEPELIKKRERDVSAIKSKVLSMYARGIFQRDIKLRRQRFATLHLVLVNIEPLVSSCFIAKTNYVVE